MLIYSLKLLAITFGLMKFSEEGNCHLAGNPGRDLKVFKAYHKCKYF